MNGRSSEDRTSSPSSLGPKANGDSPPMRPEPIRMPSRQGKTKRKVSKGMIKRVEGGGMGLMNPMGWYDAQRDIPSHLDLPPMDMPPVRLEASPDDFAVDTPDARDGEEPITESPTAMSTVQ